MKIKNIVINFIKMMHMAAKFSFNYSTLNHCAFLQYFAEQIVHFLPLFNSLTKKTIFCKKPVILPIQPDGHKKCVK